MQDSIFSPKGVLKQTVQFPKMSFEFMTKHKSISIGSFLFVLILLSAVFAPILSGYDPIETNGGARLSPPSWDHLMGTDQLGRDIFSRVLFGARSSLIVGGGVVFITTLAGVSVGVLSGYYPRIDGVVMRVIDGFMAFPAIIIAIMLAAVWGTGKMNIIFALSFAYFSRMARVARGSVLSIKNQDYVDSVRVLGARDRHILWKYILLNSLSPIIVQATFVFAISILDEAALSFLGIGIQAPEPSWGGMINDGRNYMTVSPWLMLFPGGVMFAAVLGLNILGDGLRDLLDPRQKQDSVK